MRGAEESQADYCENVLGSKYSWGYENLVPGCNVVTKDPSNMCKCCEPLATGKLLFYIDIYCLTLTHLFNFIFEIDQLYILKFANNTSDMKMYFTVKE